MLLLCLRRTSVTSVASKLAHLCVLLGPVHGSKSLHVLLDVLLRLVLHILVTLKVLWISASFQLLIHNSMS